MASCKAPVLIRVSLRCASEFGATGSRPGDSGSVVFMGVAPIGSVGRAALLWLGSRNAVQVLQNQARRCEKNVCEINTLLTYPPIKPDIFDGNLNSHAAMKVIPKPRSAERGQTLSGKGFLRSARALGFALTFYLSVVMLLVIPTKLWIVPFQHPTRHP